MSIIVPSRHTGIGAWVNSKLYTSILYNFINFINPPVLACLWNDDIDVAERLVSMTRSAWGYSA